MIYHNDELKAIKKYLRKLRISEHPDIYQRSEQLEKQIKEARRIRREYDNWDNHEDLKEKMDDTIQQLKWKIRDTNLEIKNEALDDICENDCERVIAAIERGDSYQPTESDDEIEQEIERVAPLMMR